jgi:hypothetical protein
MENLDANRYSLSSIFDGWIVGGLCGKKAGD